jgi:predicted transcriptional regulator
VTAGRKRKPTSESKTALVSTFVDIPTKATLDEFAHDDDSSLSRILRQAIADYIERRKKNTRAA